MTVIVATFYKFVPIAAPQQLRAELIGEMRALDMRGTILVAGEGINGTVSGEPAAMATFLAGLRGDPRFADLVTKEAAADGHPFKRLKVKVKREIITLRRPEADLSAYKGTYVAPEDWNALIAEPDVLLLDTRNAYEVAAGTFEGAVDPGVCSFTELPAFVEARFDPARDRRIAMFCTGGIRCEKAAAYLKARGFAEVYQLEGGILAYLARVEPESSRWRGSCFVFDERETVAGGMISSTSAPA